MRRVSFPVHHLIQIVSMWPAGHRSSSTLQVKALRQVQIQVGRRVVAFDSAGKHACRSSVSQWNLAPSVSTVDTTLQPMQLTRLTQLTDLQLQTAVATKTHDVRLSPTNTFYPLLIHRRDERTRAALETAIICTTHLHCSPFSSRPGSRTSPIPLPELK